MKRKNIIIGAGPAGIGLGIILKKDSLIIERGFEAGGFSRSVNINGAIFDFGGHSFHTPHPEVSELVFNSLEMYEQKRNAKCFSNGQIISYPFQKSFRELKNINIVNECSEGLKNTFKNVNKSDFRNTYSQLLFIFLELFSGTLVVFRPHLVLGLLRLILEFLHSDNISFDLVFNNFYRRITNLVLKYQIHHNQRNSFTYSD